MTVVIRTETPFEILSQFQRFARARHVRTIILFYSTAYVQHDIGFRAFSKLSHIKRLFVAVYLFASRFAYTQHKQTRNQNCADDTTEPTMRVYY